MAAAPPCIWCGCSRREFDREDHTKDIDFTRAGIRTRWQAGYAEHRRGRWSGGRGDTTDRHRWWALRSHDPEAETALDRCVPVVGTDCGHVGAIRNPSFRHHRGNRLDDDASLHRVLDRGGGAAGLRLASLLGASLGRRHKASITLVDKSRIHVWKPLLHEVASGSLDSETDSLELIAHARRRHYRYRIGAMVGLDRAKRQVHVAPSVDEDGETIIPPRVLGYDTLVIAVGSVSNDFGTPGVGENAITLDTLDQAARFNRRMINACLRANAQYEPLRPGQLHCAIIGAGATGVELAAELHKSMRDLASYNLDRIDFDMHIKIDLIEAAPRILPALPESLADTRPRRCCAGSTSTCAPVPGSWRCVPARSFSTAARSCRRN